MGTLDNGLTYIIKRNTEPQDRAELRLAVNAGSLQEDADQLGLAHFLEHMLFNGIAAFPSRSW
ncbi:MAG: insulinase family protein [Caldilineaceae bacterium]